MYNEGNLYFKLHKAILTIGLTLILKILYCSKMRTKSFWTFAKLRICRILVIFCWLEIFFLLHILRPKFFFYLLLQKTFYFTFFGFHSHPTPRGALPRLCLKWHWQWIVKSSGFQPFEPNQGKTQCIMSSIETFLFEIENLCIKKLKCHVWIGLKFFDKCKFQREINYNTIIAYFSHI